MSLRDDPNFLFTLRVAVHKHERFGGMVTVHAFDAQHEDPHTGHRRIDVVVNHGGITIFKRGTLYCGVNRWTSVDGLAAKELVMSLVAMRPGDTDEDYFEPYSKEQLAWAEEFGEEISCEREFRFCDENGNPKREAS